MKYKVKLIIVLQLQTTMLKVLLNKCIKFSKSIEIYTAEPIIHFKHSYYFLNILISFSWFFTSYGFIKSFSHWLSEHLGIHS